ncbi:MAG: pyridoxal phosphate-dependent aminotransferase [Elusimicrobia bacterium]|nr:pyridoxal phosphate-dependent aminotransferase [Elusimicrobiota bacterium]
MRRVPADGINLFQSIYGLLRGYSEKTGLPPLNLSLGNPDGVPPEPIRALKAKFAADPRLDYHAYAEDRDLHGFAEAMVELHGGIRVREHGGLRALPIPGIKTASALIPLACGLHLPGARRRERFVLAVNAPAYDVAGVWAAQYLAGRRLVWPLESASDMRLKAGRLERALREEGLERADLVFVIRPGNPASVGAGAAEWRALIAHCLRRGTRLVNDAAYAGLAGPGHVPLAAVAKDFPGLEWLELYSVSKSFSDPGARLGALVGSADFVADFATIKGNAESGPVPSVMAAYGQFLGERAAARSVLEGLRSLYRARLDYLIPRLKAAGLRPACPTEAGFFTLWRVPRRVLGVDLAKDLRCAGLPAAEAFNRLVAAETGLGGVHFPGLIRYAVCADVLSADFQGRFEKGLRKLRPEYD